MNLYKFQNVIFKGILNILEKNVKIKAILISITLCSSIIYISSIIHIFNIYNNKTNDFQNIYEKLHISQINNINEKLNNTQINNINEKLDKILELLQKKYETEVKEDTDNIQITPETELKEDTDNIQITPETEVKEDTDNIQNIFFDDVELLNECYDTNTRNNIKKERRINRLFSWF